jgi:hypothetical protein
VASLTRKAIEDLKKAYGISDIRGCPTCRGVYIIGMPGLFATAYRDPEILSHEEARSFFHGCPECGEDVKTYPIVLPGVREGGIRGRPTIPDPWPISEWPVPSAVPGKRGNIYDGDEERRTRYEPA